MNKKNKIQDSKQNDLDIPDPETLHTTDPQEHMEGPVSSLVKDVKKIGERNKPESKEIKYNKP
jgi:hypothetical protein